MRDLSSAGLVINFNAAKRCALFVTIYALSLSPSLSLSLSPALSRVINFSGRR